MAKSADAFRTISEVADWLGIQAHVLRFWESKFTQVKPIKRAGGRRYYRPADMQLLGGIKKLLHDDGLTIKGVQKILREDGMSHVAALSIPLDESDQVDVELTPAPSPLAIKTPEPEGVVLPFDQDRDIKKPDEAVDVKQKSQEDVSIEETLEPVSDEPAQAPEVDAQEPEPVNHIDADPVDAPATVEESAAETEPPAVKTPPADAPAPAVEPPAKLPSFLNKPLTPEQDASPTDNPPPDPEPATAMPDAASSLNEVPKTDTPEPATETAPPASKPRVIDLPPFTPESDFTAAPASLTAAVRTRRLNRDQASKIKPVLAQLTALRTQMAQKRRPAPRS